MEVCEGRVQPPNNKEIEGKQDESRRESIRGEGRARGGREEEQEGTGGPWNDLEMVELDMLEKKVLGARMCLQELDQNIMTTVKDGRKAGSGK